MDGFVLLLLGSFVEWWCSCEALSSCSIRCRIDSHFLECIIKVEIKGIYTFGRHRGKNWSRVFQTTKHTIDNCLYS